VLVLEHVLVRVFASSIRDTGASGATRQPIARDVSSSAPTPSREIIQKQINEMRFAINTSYPDMTLACKKPAMLRLANGGLVAVPSAPPRWCITKHQRDNTSTTSTLKPGGFAAIRLRKAYFPSSFPSALMS
jgi:hypothetical protein